jgi:hypothetical protein
LQIVVLITGDLTDDGLVSQLERARIEINKFVDSCPNILILPGNHDYRHPYSSKLVSDASKLIGHYDRWLEQYDENRKKDPSHQYAFTFVGPEGFPFPRQLATKFQEYFKGY